LARLSAPGRRTAVIAASVAGVAAFILAFAAIEKNKDSGGGAETVKVVVATKEIPEQTRITADMVTLADIEDVNRESGALRWESDAVHMVSSQNIPAGGQVTTQKLIADRPSVGLSLSIPERKRAVSVSISEVYGSGGLIVPGDFVDVVAVFKKDDLSCDCVQPVARMILQNVEVLAVAQTYVNSQGKLQEGSDEGDANGDAQPTAKSVTLAVTPEESQALAMGDDLGELHLALRPLSDDSKTTVTEMLLMPGK
jgi:pilus assembly protein CpaB